MPPKRKDQLVEPEGKAADENTTADGSTSLDISNRIELEHSPLRRVEIATIHVLREGGGYSSDKPLSAKDILKQIKEMKLELGISDSSFFPYLSSCSSLDNGILSAGRGRGSGYYLVEDTAKTTNIDYLAEADEKRKRNVEREAPLYPLLVSWLTTQDYRSQITATMKDLGKWGNPDVTGIAVTEHLTSLSIEIATIEAKVGTGPLPMDFFEAVAHRRWANRAYFAYPKSDLEGPKLFGDPGELRYMSEKFGVGVLVVLLPDETIKKLINRQDGKTVLDPSECEVVEVLPSRYSQVPLRYQREFCEALKIKDLEALFDWAKETSQE
jgi:hypothetical protein